MSLQHPRWRNQWKARTLNIYVTNMVNFVELPTEILIRIFSKNKKDKEKLKLIRISKKTKQIAQLIAYQHITLTTHQAIRQLTKTLRFKPTLALLIKSITLVSKTTTTNQSNQNHDESMTFFAFTALLRYTHNITHLHLDLQGSNVFELTQLFQAISDSKSSNSIQSLIYRTRNHSSLSTEPDLTQLVSNLTCLTSLSIIGNTRYSNSFHGHHVISNNNNNNNTIFPPENSTLPPQLNQSLNYSTKLVSLPPIKSLTISSSRLFSNSSTNIHKLIKLCWNTLKELTICGGMDETSNTTTTIIPDEWIWTRNINEKNIEKLTLIGSFFHNIDNNNNDDDQQQPQQDEPSSINSNSNSNTLDILSLDWTNLIRKKFKNLKSLNLINDFNWLDSIPIVIPFITTTSPINTIDLNPSRITTTTTTNPNPNPISNEDQVELTIPEPSSLPIIPAEEDTITNSQNQLTTPSTTNTNNTITITYDDPLPPLTALLNNLPKTTYYLDYKNLESLPKSLIELTIETNHIYKKIYYSGQQVEQDLDDHFHDDDNTDTIRNGDGDEDGGEDLNNNVLLDSQYRIDIQTNWKPQMISSFFSHLENLTFIKFNHLSFFKPYHYIHSIPSS